MFTEDRPYSPGQEEFGTSESLMTSHKTSELSIALLLSLLQKNKLLFEILVTEAFTSALII